jgi:hypothetical protein
VQCVEGDLTEIRRLQKLAGGEACYRVGGLKLGAVEQATAAQHADRPLWQAVIPTRVQNAALGLEDNLAGAFEGEAKLAADASVGRARLAQGEYSLAQGGGLGLAPEASLGGR